MIRTLRLLLPATLAFTLSAHASNPLQVKTGKGKVEGALTSDGKVVAFKGIPYAAPPVGDLRWKPPIPASKWSGVKQTIDFGSHCVQTNPFQDMVFRDPGESEDCLTLNVWTPKGAKPGSLPVMVWIYGGGFTSGSTSEARQDGQFLAHRNVVVVSMNYRLGIFGFFAHPGLVEESPHHAAGNYGLLDQAAAIAWVKENIKGFGGDPANITLFGESAGSVSVSAQMASPLSKDNIQKAIGESGSSFPGSGPGSLPVEAAAKAGADFGERAFHASSISDLRKISAADLVKAVTAKTTAPPPHFSGDIDGYFLPDSVPNIFAAGKQAHIPMIAGWNADEVRSSITMAAERMTAERFKTQIQAEYGDKADSFLQLYQASNDEQAVESAGDYADDRFIAFSTWRWLEAQVQNGNAPVYRYRFDLATDGDKFHSAGAGAYHSDEIDYVFGTLDARVDFKVRPEDRKVSDQMQMYWTNFARTGDPNKPSAADLPKWPGYNQDGSWQVMHLDADSDARPDNQRDRYLFLEGAWGKPQP